MASSLILAVFVDLFFILTVFTLIFLLGFKGYQKIQRYLTNKKYRNISEKINLLFFDKNTFRLSQDERANPKFKKSNYDLTYGEIHSINFLYLLNQASPKRNELFVDLGSGAGKCALAAKFAYPSIRCYGIELLAKLHEVALQVLQNIQNQEPGFNIDFLCGDYFDADLSAADIIFINATALNEPLWETLVKKFKQLPQCVRIITTTKRLPEDNFKCIYQGLEYASWGWVSAFVYVKL